MSKLKTQVFNPDNVMLADATEGTIPGSFNELIVDEVMENSIVMQLGKYEQMDSQEKEFQYFLEGPGAYWVGEGQKIQTSKAKWTTVKMTSAKLGIIMPVSREFLHYKVSNFFDIMRPRIAEAFYKKFDEAVILNKDNPFNQSIVQSIETAGNNVEDKLDYNGVITLEDALLKNDVEANAYISKAKNRTKLRGALDPQNLPIYDRTNNTLDGRPIVDFKSMEDGTIIAGDFNKLFYGIPFDLSYEVSTDAQLSTITNEDGTPVNLFEQELMALRVTMDLGMLIVKDEAFALLKEPEGA
ncbi:phage major capsid protein [Dolosicoccus paucivorans]